MNNETNSGHTFSRAKVNPEDVIDQADVDHVEHNPDPKVAIDPDYSDGVEPFDELDFEDGYEEDDPFFDEVDEFDFDFDTTSVDGDE